MSNLDSARQAIMAELDHANQGIAFYEAKVKALEEALAKLDSIEGGEEQSRGTARRTAAVGKMLTPATKTAAPSRGRGRPKRSDTELPFTGKDFWPNLITEEPRSAPEILAAAIKSLGI